MRPRCRGFAALVAIVATAPAPAWPTGGTARTTEIVRRDCGTTVGGQEVTFFGNGTLRLRTRLDDEEKLKLTELDPSERDALIRRLQEEDLSEVEEGRAEVLGDLVEQCTIDLELPGREPERFRFGRFDSLPLGLARLSRIVDDMVELVEQRSPAAGLPPGYEPRSGDRLERADGALFEVVALTSDGRGVELRGVDLPLTIFIAGDDLGAEFVAVVRRRAQP